MLTPEREAEIRKVISEDDYLEWGGELLAEVDALRAEVERLSGACPAGHAIDMGDVALGVSTSCPACSWANKAVEVADERDGARAERVRAVLMTGIRTSERDHALETLRLLLAKSVG